MRSSAQLQSLAPARSRIRGRFTFIILAVLFLTPAIASAQSFTVLYNFPVANSGGVGASLWSGGIAFQATDGDMYGMSPGMLRTANDCIPGSCGTIFHITTAGVPTVLYSFNYTNGAFPSGLVQGSNGNFYGTTEIGGTGSGCSPWSNGCGTIFQLTPQGLLTTLYDFSGGDYPIGLSEGTDGNFYIITGNASMVPPGACLGCGGGVFKLALPGTLTGLYEFCGQTNCPTGAYPDSILQAADGNLYGTTSANGSLSLGTFFKIASDGTFTSLYAFCTTGYPTCSDGFGPGGLIQATDGDLYGTTGGGGAYSAGTVFKITSAGTLTTLYSFCSLTNCADGGGPFSSMIQATDGNFYGLTGGGGTGTCTTAGSTTTGCGTLFRITPSGALTTLYNFCSEPNCADGRILYNSNHIVQGADRLIYGTTGAGGANNTGVFFSFSAGLSGSAASSTSFALNPSSVAVGSSQPVALTATVSSQPGGTPTGTVAFYNGSNYLGSAVLSSGTGTFNYDPANLAVSAYQISANYNGDATFAVSSSPAQTLTVNPAPPAAAPTFSPASGSYGSIQTVTISDTTAGATIYYTTDGTAPTTSSAVYSQPIAVGSTETIQAMAAAKGFSNSSVTTAKYTITLSPDYQIAVNPSTLTIIAGQTGTAVFTVTPVNGFNSPVNFTCSGLPAEATCNFNPSSVTPGNGNPTTSTLTLNTIAPSTAALQGAKRYRFTPIYVFFVFGLGVVFCVRPSGRKSRNSLGIFSTFMGITLAIGMTSCGSSGNKIGNPGTPLGTSTVTVRASTSASGGMSHSASVTITIAK